MPKTAASETWRNVLDQDEFDDSLKRASLKTSYYPPRMVQFIKDNYVKEMSWLDIGCGTGQSLSIFSGLTHAVEPNAQRRLFAVKNAAACGRTGGQKVFPDYAEDLSFVDESFGTVTYLYGFFQCRSDAEALIEINRVLKEGGRFIVNVPTQPDTCFGRAYHEKNFIELLKHFGFHFLKSMNPGDHETRLFVFWKKRTFSAACYLKPQLRPMPRPGFFSVRNASSLNYWKPAGFTYEAIEERYEGLPVIKVKSWGRNRDNRWKLL